MKGRSIPYSDAELFWIEDNRRRPRKEAHAEFVYLWDRPDVSLSNFNSLCKRMGWMTGRTGSFKAGRTPHNKGKGMPEATKAKCARTWFRKSSMNGRAAQLHQPIGTERIAKDGYRERKVRDDGLPQHRWRAVHLIEWEAANGPVPEGYCLKCLDGDRTNTDRSNWEAIPRALLPRLSGGRWFKPYAAYEPEVRPVVLTAAKLDHAAREARKAGAKA